jgi:cytochrome oxidase Cu insertion factor (SCO1/SenC/PrrC family)
MSIGGRISSWVGKPLFWVLFVAISLGVQITRGILAPKPPVLPRALGAVEMFRLTDQHLRPFGTPEISGTVWLASVFCKACPSVDPKLLDRLHDIQHRSRNLGHKFQIVSFAVDPETDRPETLADFALAQRASMKRWSFLSGSRPELKKIISSIYEKDPLQPADTATASQALDPGANHRLALIDQATQVRGFFDARQDAEVERMLVVAAQLLNVRFRPAPVPSSTITPPRE